MNPFDEKKRETKIVPKPPKPPTTTKSLSRIHGMTVGDVRQCFSQMRTTSHLSSNTTLWCGITAGHFALVYLVNTAGASRRKRSSSVSGDS